MISGTFTLEDPTTGDIRASRSEDLCVVARDLGLLRSDGRLTLTALELLELYKAPVGMLEDLAAGRLE